ncbi:MAG: D-sedoheptulose 7-phosphate isomerase [Bacteroidota bacterium]
MSVEIIKASFLEAKMTLDSYIKDDSNFDKINVACDLMVSAVKNKKKILSCGNGGSMCDAMHFAEELTGRFRNNRAPIPAIAISDPSHITCTGNDYGFENIFSRYIECIGNEGDVLFAISTSGNSLNIINAAAEAKRKKMHVIGLTGKNGGKLKDYCDIELRVHHQNYSDRIQEIHIKIIHTIIQCIELKLTE